MWIDHTKILSREICLYIRLGTVQIWEQINKLSLTRSIQKVIQTLNNSFYFKLPGISLMASSIRFHLSMGFRYVQLKQVFFIFFFCFEIQYNESFSFPEQWNQQRVTLATSCLSDTSIDIIIYSYCCVIYSYAAQPREINF